MVCSNFGNFKLLNGFYVITKGNELLMRAGAMLRKYFDGDPCTAYGRIIPPSLFVSILEEHGKIWQLDYYVWREACRLLKSWQGTDFANCYISVISVKDMYYLDFYEIFTENVFMDKPKEAISLIHCLKEYGFVVAIDDVGSSYSNLSFF